MESRSDQRGRRIKAYNFNYDPIFRKSQKVETVRQRQSEAAKYISISIKRRARKVIVSSMASALVYKITAAFRRCCNQAFSFHFRYRASQTRIYLGEQKRVPQKLPYLPPMPEAMKLFWSHTRFHTYVLKSFRRNGNSCSIGYFWVL